MHFANYIADEGTWGQPAARGRHVAAVLRCELIVVGPNEDGRLCGGLSCFLGVTRARPKLRHPIMASFCVEGFTEPLSVAPSPLTHTHTDTHT